VGKTLKLAEGLARQILRVAILRERTRSLQAIKRSGHLTEGISAAQIGEMLQIMDGVLHDACRAIGNGDVVAMTASGQLLEDITE